jgi:hypothetical protein
MTKGSFKLPFFFDRASPDFKLQPASQAFCRISAEISPPDRPCQQFSACPYRKDGTLSKPLYAKADPWWIGSEKYCRNYRSR